VSEETRLILRLLELLLEHQERQTRLLVRLLEGEEHEEKFYLASVGLAIKVPP
jgi:hypothetical protein